MKWLPLLTLFLVTVARSEVESEIKAREDVDTDVEELPLAQPCVPEACQLPDCRCSSTDIPGGLRARDTPQFVTVTFDDGINVLNVETYREVLYNRRNINGCRAGATFYVSHEYTNYQVVNELYNQGFEIALHSMSHRTPQTYWAEASYEDLMREFGDQRLQIAHFANIPYDEIKGLRLPFLQMTGNSSFQVISDVGLTYDSSWSSINFLDPGMWPYTLDYASTQDCQNLPCPSASFPGVWVQPMLSWLDLTDTACAMADGCFSPPDLTDEEAWFKFILTNFERHYFGNRAPFGFYLHEGFVSANPAVKNAFRRFLDLINNLNDVFMVNTASIIDWIKNPVPVNEYRERPCPAFTQTFCSAQTCALNAAHNGLEYWMAICNVCPRVYPWLGNPLGQ